jgi:hypothetical protein
MQQIKYRLSKLVLKLVWNFLKSWSHLYLHRLQVYIVVSAWLWQTTTVWINTVSKNVTTVKNLFYILYLFTSMKWNLESTMYVFRSSKLIWSQFRTILREQETAANYVTLKIFILTSSITTINWRPGYNWNIIKSEVTTINWPPGYNWNMIKSGVTTINWPPGYNWNMVSLWWLPYF